MKLVVIGVMEEEVIILRSKFEYVKIEIIVYCEFIIGEYEGIEVIFLKLGIGKVNVVISIMFLFDCYKFDYVINIGLVGGFYYILNVGDVVIFIDVCYYDVDVIVFDYEYG